LNLARSKLHIFHRDPLFSRKAPSSCYLDMVVISLGTILSCTGKRAEIFSDYSNNCVQYSALEKSEMLFTTKCHLLCTMSGNTIAWDHLPVESTEIRGRKGGRITGQ
jgi:hypothetical protein